MNEYPEPPEDVADRSAHILTYDLPIPALRPVDAAELRRMLWGPNRRQDPPTLPTGCYEASWGWVHVKPDCRCPH